MPLVQVNDLHYSDKYFDDEYEYRHVILPKDLAKHIPRTHLMTESEWRNIGIAQSPGWVHYMLHGPEPHILMFRRPLSKEQKEKMKKELEEEENNASEEQENIQN